VDGTSDLYRSLRLETSLGPVQAEKRISLPDKAPFGISEGAFAIVAALLTENRNPMRKRFRNHGTIRGSVPAKGSMFSGIDDSLSTPIRRGWQRALKPKQADPAQVPPKVDKWSFNTFAGFEAEGEAVDNVDAVEVDGKCSPRFKYHAYVQIIMNQEEKLLAEGVLEHQKLHVEGYKWLYERNVKELTLAEGRTFESKLEAIEFGRNFYKSTLEWQPFKWRLYAGWFNPLNWFFHNGKWGQCAKNRDWN